MVSAKGKIAQAFSIPIDIDSLSTPLPKASYIFPSYTQLPVTKAFQTHNSLSLKSNSFHRRGKGKAALPIL
jgi:hypothetical protein